MRSITFVLAVLGASAPTAALSWQEYEYKDYGFAVAFPAAPNIETTTHTVADGRSVPARVYSVRQNNVVMKMTVADLAGTNLTEDALLDHAIKVTAAGGKVELNIPQRIYRVYGRAFTVKGTDGSYSMGAVFDYNKRLYQIEGKALPGANPSETEFDVVRFQQSLTFTDGGTNRSEDAIRAIRESCRGLAGAVNAAGNPVTPAGLDDPRCQVVAPER